MEGIISYEGLKAALRAEITQLALARLAPYGMAEVLIDRIGLDGLIEDHRGERIDLQVEIAVCDDYGGVPNYLTEVTISLDLGEVERREKVLLGNAFSLQMLDREWANIKVEPVWYPTQEKGLARARSIIGHPDTAKVVSGLLNREVECNRESVTLSVGDVLYVAQVTGGRLPEGATKLPEGVEITFRKVIVMGLE